jgi:hypothetical protein
MCGNDGLKHLIFWNVGSNKNVYVTKGRKKEGYPQKKD